MKTEGQIQETSSQLWLQEWGLRPTRTRRLLFEVLQNAAGPQSVPELLEALKKRKYAPHKTTLYREIEQLVVKGALTKVQLSEERVSYELSGHHHHHFVCQICTRVTELSVCEEIMGVISSTLGRQGKQVERHTFEFFGVCELCL